MKHAEQAGSAPRHGTVVALLRWRAEHQPDRLAYRFLRDGERDEATLTYAELDRAARAVSARLVDLGARGERAILLYPPGLEYITAFFGCLYAGTLAVPAYPPDPARLERGLDRLAAIVRDARPLVTLTTSGIVATIEALAQARAGSGLPALVPTDGIPAELGHAWGPPAIDADSTAFLQYTSGSTATPRGVVLSHGNLLHNSGLIQQFFGSSPETQALAWLPPYHDMGLIGGIIQPLYGGFPITLMSPSHFLERPSRWLEAVSRYRATASGGPNFAYDLCVRRTASEERAGLDLRTWRMAFNGAEPVRPETLERFAAAFEESGFRREAFLPCYGLAEATLIVTGGVPWSGTAAPPPGTDGTGTGRLVSCGRPAADQRVEIVDAVTRERCLPGQVGEVWVAGPSVARSYWSRPDESREVFQGRLAGTGEGPFLRTGDLGLVRDGGQLYITGRLKDLIVIHGRNHYPQDIEWTAERSHPALRPGCGAAFTAPDGGGQDRLVVAWELAARAGEVDVGEVARAVRVEVAREHDVQLRTVVLLRPGGIPKTSSGKVQRGLCARWYASGELAGRVVDLPAGGAGEVRLDRASLAAAPPAGRLALLQEYLCQRIGATCGVVPGEIDLDQPLLALGADSLAVVDIQQGIQADLGVTLPLAELTGSASLAGIVRRLDGELAAHPGGVIPEPADATRPEVGRTATPEPDTGVTEAAPSDGQRALWFLHQLAPGSAEHNVALALRLHGRLDVAALRRALDGLVARHAVLRTTFESHDGEPVARVSATGTALLLEHDARAVTGPDLTGPLSDAANEPFDLASGPLLRVDLYHTAPGETVMLAVAHHIVIDFLSMSTLVQELETLYAAGGPDDPAAALPPRPPSYADVVAWRERALTGDSGRALRAYWAEELRDAVEELPLPHVETGAVPGAPARAGTCRLRLDEALTRRVRQRARAEGVTPYMLLLAAYQLLLHRYTGQDDLLIGTPMAGRGRPEFERVVGYCMNPVAIRSRLDGGESVREVLAQVRRRVIGALEHQTYPLHLLATDRRPGAPLFRTLFILNRRPASGADHLAPLAAGEPGIRCPFAELVAEPVPVPLHEAPVDLHLSLVEIDDLLFATFRYRTGLLDDGAARRMMGHFANIVAAIADDVEQPASAVAMLDGAERHRILAVWSATGSGHQPGVTVPALIERQAAATPDAVAVTGEGGDLTYRDLNERANRVAHLLTHQGIGQGARIGLCLDRSPEMIVALLAVLKSGAAYVPADPAHPHDRIAATFAEAGVAIVLSQRRLVGQLPDGVAAVLLDGEPALARQRTDNLSQRIADGSPAYVLYTSGSSGAPKGVVVSHRSLANYVRFAAGNLAMSAGDRVLQFASLGFDASGEEIYAALSSGATLVLRNDRMLSSPGAFLAQCARWAITVLDLPTAYWHELVVGITGTGTPVPSMLRLVVIGGERAVPDLARSWHAHVGTRVRLINSYGPTEATIVAVTRDLTGFDAPGEVPIGRPIPGATAYVLDRLRRPVPAGVVGELYLGGVGLADGYLNRPGLTAQSFVPHPFASGSRLYRTGDLACFTEDGELVSQGRADRQVKLRGYRVEPGEIESVLRDLPEIADALVVLRENPRQLVGYLVSAGSTAPDTVAVRTALRRRLPEYMVPSAFVTVPSFPLNHNGKVDVAALPAPAAAAGPRGRTGARTPVEQFLVDTFAEVLGLTAVGVDDDFFGRGGHSLLATKVLARIRDRFQVDIPLRALFETPTPAGLAELVARGASGAPELPPPRPVPRDQPLPLSFVQERIWFLQMLAPESTAYNVPRALRIRGDFDPEILVRTLAALERRHEMLRTTFTDIDGEAVQVVHPPRGIPLATVDLREVPGDEREDRIQHMILEAGRTPFNLADGPLIRLTLACFGPSEHVLVVIEHHLIHDGWAQGVFLRDFLELYEALRTGREPRLPELPVQFADYAHWQRRAMSGRVLDDLIAFWTRELSGAPHTLALPTDRPYPPVLTFAGGLETLVIDGRLGAALRGLSRERGATLFMTMVSAFATLLYRYSGQDDMLVGVGVANRQRPEAENLLGMLINTVLLRARMSGNPSFAGLLDRVREACLRMYAHQDMPFEKLVEVLRPKRSRAHMPLCQVTFTFLDTPMPRLAASGLSIDVVGVHNRTAKFDLNIIVQPHAEQRPRDGGADADGRITVLMEYNADVFEAATARQMLNHFHAVLAAAADAPGQPLDAFLAELPPPAAHQQPEGGRTNDPAATLPAG
ncbi:amino acid adenylation domain-containing protein [Phytohabitans suffuscus]